MSRPSTAHRASAARPWAAPVAVTTCRCGHPVSVHQDGSDPRGAGACHFRFRAPDGSVSAAHRCDCAWFAPEGGEES